MEREMEEGTADLEKIKSLHDEAYLYVSQALDYEEQNKMNFSMEMYKQGKQRLEEALSVRCDRQYCVGIQWNMARKMQQKMQSTLQEVRERLKALDQLSLSDVASAPPVLERPPSYDEACASNIPLTLRMPSNNIPRAQSLVVENIFTIPDGVQLFFVSPDGQVKSLNEPTSLHIYKFVDLQTPTTTTIRRPPAWLQIGDWNFPLIPGQSPALHSGYGAYFFPDVNNKVPGSSVGIILPGSSEINLREEFENYMLELTLLEQEEQIVPGVDGVADYSIFQPDADGASHAPMRMSHKISQGVIVGADMVSKCLVKGAEVTGSLVQKGAHNLRERLRPEERAVPVNPRLQQGLVTLRNVSGTACKVSGAVVSKLGQLTMALGRQMAPHIKTQGNNLLVKSGFVNKDTVDSANGKSPVDDIMVVAAGGLQGFATVYTGLETAAKMLAYSLANETVQTAHHKYGPQVGGAVDNAVFSLGNVALTTHNVTNLGVKAIAKRTAKDTGKAILVEYIEKKDKSQALGH